MNSSQRNYYNMARAVNTYLDANTATWSNIAIMNSSKTELVNLLDQIAASLEAQNTAQVTIGERKSAARRALAIKADVLSDALEVYGELNANHELQSQADRSMTDFFRLTDTDLKAEVDKLLNLLNTHKANMTDYGVSEAQITELSDALNSYESNYMGAARSYRIASRQATEDLEEQISNLRETINLLDKKVKILKRSQPTFYRGYEAAREIVDV